MSDTTLKNIVLIGGCSGGAYTARELEKTLPNDYRLVLIEKNEMSYWPAGGLRAAVKPGFEKEIFGSFDGFFGIDSRHIVLAGYTVLEVKENTVKLDKVAPAPFDSDVISLEAGVISTGTKYAVPMRPISANLAEAQQGLRKMQEDVAKSEEILIVGGGPVGVEFAGEVMYNHPDKKVTLVDMEDALFKDYRAPLGKMIVDQLKSIHVDVRLGTSLELTKEHFDNSQRLVPEKHKVKLSDGTQVNPDFLFLASGGKPNTDLVPDEALDDGKPRRIDVNPTTMQLRLPSLSKWFALGDVSNLPHEKTHVNATNEAPVVAAQLIAMITGSKCTKLYKAPAMVMLVPIGPTLGASQMIYPVFGNWVTSFIKGKSLFVSQFLKVYPGGAAVA